jgi:hypothetical protein
VGGGIGVEALGGGGGRGWGSMFSNRIIEPYRKGTDKMINRDKSSISPINQG